MPDAAAHQLQKTVDEITGYTRRTRKLVRGLIAVTAVAILVAVGCGYLYVRLHDSQLDNCAASNQTRMQQQLLWETVLKLAIGPDPSLSGRAFEDKTMNDVRTAYAQVDCTTRYPFW